MSKILLLLILFNMLANSGRVIVVLANTHSFVYSYGGVKLWVSVDLNETWSLGQNQSIQVKLYLEDLGRNKEIFVNRITVDLGDTNIRHATSPNTTLNCDNRLYHCHLMLNESEISKELVSSSTRVDFEIRYDIVDSTSTCWPFIVNDYIPIRLENISKNGNYWLNPVIVVFIIVIVSGFVASSVILWFRIRRLRETQ